MLVADTADSNQWLAFNSWKTRTSQCKYVSVLKTRSSERRRSTSTLLSVVDSRIVNVSSTVQCVVVASVVVASHFQQFCCSSIAISEVRVQSSS